jgi:hypothetical protein
MRSDSRHFEMCGVRSEKADAQTWSGGGCSSVGATAGDGAGEAEPATRLGSNGGK